MLMTAVLDRDRQGIFDQLGGLADLGALGGGTALALQLKHH